MSALVQAGYDDIIARLLGMRGITSPGAAERFLHPSWDDMHDPFLLRGMAEAVERIRAAVSAGERVVIYGDYDADGVTAVAILKGYFAAIGMQADYYIPRRRGEGYGLNCAAVRELAADHTLMITVDCGIDCVEEVRLAGELGMDVIVTDHHQLKAELPPALAVIDPQMGGYPESVLCGAGVAFKLVEAMGGRDQAENWLDLAALATIADIVPLTGENRAIAYLGLEKMNAKGGLRVGLRALMRAADMQEGRRVTAGTIGFAIGPRINAGGRIDRSERSVELLLTGDEAVAAAIAGDLEDNNTERQRQERLIMADCERLMAEQVDLRRDRAIVILGKGWNVGVVGIAASRLAERWHMPCVLCTDDGDGTVTGSCRSIPGVHIFRAVGACSGRLIRFGGHEMAAGLTLARDEFDAFRRELNRWLEDNVSPECYLPSACYDVEADPSALGMPLCGLLESMAPFGMGNPTPVFLLRSVRAERVRRVGQEQQHLRFSLPGGAECVAYSMADSAAGLEAPVDLLANLSASEWGGRTSAQLIVRAISPSADAFDQTRQRHGDELLRDYLLDVVYNEKKLCPAPDIARIDALPRLSRGDAVLFAGTGPARAPEGSEAVFAAAPVDDGRALGCAVFAPVAGDAFAGYERFYIVGEADAGMCARLLEVSPQARFFHLAGSAPEWPVPQRGRLGAVYKYIVSSAQRLASAGSAEKAAARAAADIGVSRLEFYIAALVFRELGFIAMELSPWRLEARCRPEHRALEDSRLYRHLVGERQL